MDPFDRFLGLDADADLPNEAIAAMSRDWAHDGDDLDDYVSSEEE